MCKADGQKTGTCAYCGTVFYTAGVTFIYGETEKESYSSEFRLTDKYLIVKCVSKAEMVGSITAEAVGYSIGGLVGGLIGGMAANAVETSQKKSYGFYDLQELQKVIYPYHTDSLKKDTAFKFINKDGSDFVLNFNLNGLFSDKAAKNFADTLVKVGIYVENGSCKQYPFCCMNPFVNRTTFGTRVCPSAATFVKMTDQQFIAQPISNVVETLQQPLYAQSAVQQPVSQEPVKSVESTPILTSAPAVDTSAWQSAWQTPVAAAPVEGKKPEQTMCPACGSMNSATARFCSKCGTAFATGQQYSFSVDDWKNKW